jgi:hypothetical protein
MIRNSLVFKSMEAKSFSVDRYSGKFGVGKAYILGVVSEVSAGQICDATTCWKTVCNLAR